MANKYLSYDEERAVKVRTMFSRIAKRYDLLNDLMCLGMHRLWKRRTAELALGSHLTGPGGALRADRSSGPGSGRRPLRVLDLCCGTGDLAFLLESRASDATVVGADFTFPMLGVARSRKAASGARCRFLQGDALTLPFRDASFDVVTIGYGLRNVADIPRALKELRRVLAPGGRLVVLDFGKPDNRLVSALYFAYLRAAMPVMGLLFHGDAQTYLYIPESLVKYPAQRGVERLMTEGGFVNVRYEERVLGTMAFNVGEAPPPASPGSATAP